MQVTSIPVPPTALNALPQEAVSKTLPQVQAQAAAPISPRAIDPSPKSERGHESRGNGEKGKGGGDGGKRGGSLNIRV